MKEANLEVELDRFRLEKRLSMTRLLSEAAVGGGEPGPLTLPSMTPSPFFGPGQGGGGMGPGSAPPAFAAGQDLEHDLGWVAGLGNGCDKRERRTPGVCGGRGA